MIAENMVVNTELYDEIDLTCKKCGKKQKYHPRSNTIPKRPKTQCQNEKCGAWIYFDGSLLVKDDQKETKNDQKREQKKPSKPKQNPTKTQKPKKQSQLELTKKADQRPNQLTKDLKLAEFIRNISGELIIAMTHAINSIKNKSDVVAKNQNSSRYHHFKNWIDYQKYFERLHEEIKNKMDIKKEKEKDV